MLIRPVVRVARLVSALLFTGALAGCGAADLTSEEYMTRARVHFDGGDLMAAVVELKNLLQREPNHAEGRKVLGLVYLEAEQGAAAEKELRRARELGVPDAELAVPFARADLLSGQFESLTEQLIQESTGGPAVALPKADRAELMALRGHAFRELDKRNVAADQYAAALELDSTNVEALLGRAHLALSESDLPGARSLLESVVSLKPETWAAWSLLGDISRYEGRGEEAETAYSRAIEHRYSDRRDLLGRALVRIYRNDIDGAKADIDSIRRLRRNDPAAAYAEGVLSFVQQDYGRARAILVEALGANPGYLPAAFYLGTSQAMLGELEQAEHHLRRVFNASPKSLEAAKALAAVIIERGNLIEAEELLHAILAEHSTDLYALEALGYTALSQGRTQEATDYLRRLVEQDPSSAHAYMKLGLTLMSFGEREAGAAALREMTELEGTTDVEVARAIVTAHLRARDFDNALAEAERFRQASPNLADAWTLVGLANLGYGNRAKADEAFQRALELEPGNQAAAQNLAHLALRKGNTAEARSQYESILAHDPGHLFTLLALSELDASEGNTNEAVVRLRRAMKFHPDALQPRVLLARYHLAQGEASRARILVEEVLAKYPNTPPLLMELGRAQLAEGKAEQALATYDELLELMPRSAGVHYRRGEALAAADDLRAARVALQNALEIEPEHLPAGLALLGIDMKEGHLTEAQSLLATLEQAHPKTPELWVRGGELAQLLGRPEQAVDAFARVMQTNPSSQIAVRLARAQWQAGAPEQAKVGLRRWLDKTPGDLNVRYTLAEVYAASGDVVAARAELERVLTAAPDFLAALNELAWLLREEEPRRAKSYAEKAAKLAPQAPAILDTLGVILINNGDPSSAVAVLERAVELAPQDDAIRYHLALGHAALGADEKARQLLDEVISDSEPFPERTEAEALRTRLAP